MSFLYVELLLKVSSTVIIILVLCMQPINRRKSPACVCVTDIVNVCGLCAHERDHVYSITIMYNYYALS